MKRVDSSRATREYEEVIEVDAPSSTVWRLLKDIEAYPKLLPQWKFVQPLPTRPKRSLSPVEPGAKFLAGILDPFLEKKLQRQQFFITNVVEEEDLLWEEEVESTRIVAMATSLYYSTGTASYKVQKLKGDAQRCQVSISYGLVPDGWPGKIFLWIQGRPLILRLAHRNVRKDLENIKRTAETRTYYGGDPIS